MKIPDIKHTVTVDFESFWSTEFTLSKLSTSEYIRDERFKVHCAAIKIGTSKTRVVWGHQEVGKALRAIDWNTHALLAQNTSFDGFIMSHCYGIVPCFYFDTKSMAAGLHNGVVRNSLKVLAPLYGVGVKDDTPLQSTKGMHDIPPELRPDMARYNIEDTEQCFAIFQKQIKNFPPVELEIIDLVIRMFCDSVLYVDVPLAREGLAAEMIARRSEILKAGEITRRFFPKSEPENVFMSNDKFAACLENFIPAPTKISKTTEKVTWAFSQTDEEFIELQDHENIDVALLVRGRLAAKSTQAETRAHRLIEAGKNGQRLPVGYTYSAALTHRLGGMNSMNLQNLPRVNKKQPKPSDALRRSIIAPPGHMIVVCDSAQIEARMLAWMCGQEDLLQQFRDGLDVYRIFASRVYDKPLEQVTDIERFAGGKIPILGLGYGMGHRKFQTTLRLGTMGPPVFFELDQCERIVKLYRTKNQDITVRGWGEASRMLKMMHAGQEGSAFGGIIEFDSSTVWLPNGMPIHYPALQIGEKGDLSYGSTKGRKKIYSGKCVENLVQAIARIVVFEQMVAIKNWLPSLKLKKNEYARVSMCTHDEVVVVVPDRHAVKTETYMQKAMCVPPAWCLDAPLDSEAGFDFCYSK